MFEQHAPDQAAAAPALSWPEDAAIIDWIVAWQAAREDFMRLLSAYAVAGAGHDISSFTPLIEQLDSAVRLLEYRVDWLRSAISPAGTSN